MSGVNVINSFRYSCLQYFDVHLVCLPSINPIFTLISSILNFNLILFVLMRKQIFFVSRTNKRERKSTGNYLHIGFALVCSFLGIKAFVISMLKSEILIDKQMKLFIQQQQQQHRQKSNDDGSNNLRQNQWMHNKRWNMNNFFDLCCNQEDFGVTGCCACA